MNDKVKELVEWVAESYYKICSSCSSLNVAWAKLLDDERKPFKEAARQILSHPDLYVRDYNVEVKGLEDLYKAFILLAEAIKEV